MNNSKNLSSLFDILSNEVRLCVLSNLYFNGERMLRNYKRVQILVSPMFHNSYQN